jgi:tetratricopeptide (TPR) repeat protein
MAVVFLASAYAYRGLYDAVPLLLAIGLAVITAVATVLWLRLAFRRDVAFQARALKSGGRFHGAGLAVLAVLPSCFGFATHSGLVQIERRLGESALIRANAMGGDVDARRTADYPAAMRTALAHLERADDWGFTTSAQLHHKLGSLCLGLADHESEHRDELVARGMEHLRRAIALDDDLIFPRLRLAEALITRGELSAAVDALSEVLARDPTRYQAAELAYDLVARAPEMPGPRLLVVDYLTATGDYENARNALAPLLEHVPDSSHVKRRVEALARAEAEATP